MKDFRELLERLQIKAGDMKLYERAFTHASFSHEHPDSNGDYDRLEFIGDGVLDLVIAHLIYERFPDKASGPLSKMRSSLVRGPALSAYAREYGFADYIRISRGELHNSDNKIQDRILEDVFEAFIGAYYLDKGFEAVFELVRRIFWHDIITYDETQLFDYKSRIQEVVQSDVKGQQVVYVVLKDEGTPQNKYFEVACMVDGLVIGVGSGPSKKKAEQAAARNALEKRID